MNDHSAKNAPQPDAERTEQAEQNETPAAGLPGFVSDEDVGLGDAIKRVTSAFGIKTCGGCERRAAALNRWFPFSGKRSR
jgi:hypothetical protein